MKTIFKIQGKPNPFMFGPEPGCGSWTLSWFVSYSWPTSNAQSLFWFASSSWTPAWSNQRYRSGIRSQSVF